MPLAMEKVKMKKAGAGKAASKQSKPRSKPAAVTARGEHTGDDDDSQSHKEKEEEQRRIIQERRKRALQELPPEGLRVCVSSAQHEQHALWQGLPDMLDGNGLKRPSFLLTNSSFKPAKGKEEQLVFGTEVEILGGRLMIHLGILCTNGTYHEQDGRVQLRTTINLPPGGLRVTCGAGKMQNHAIWMSVHGLTGGPGADRFLLTDSNHRPFKPEQIVKGRQLESMAGLVWQQRWKRSVRLAQVYEGVQPGKNLKALIEVLQQRQTQDILSDSGDSSESTSGSDDDDDDDDEDDDDEEEEEEELEQHESDSDLGNSSERDSCGLDTQVHLPAEGVRVYCQVGEVRNCALWTTVQEMVQGNVDIQGFMLTNRHYRPLNRQRLVTGQVLVMLSGGQEPADWRRSVMLGMPVGGLPVGTSLQEFLDKAPGVYTSPGCINQMSGPPPPKRQRVQSPGGGRCAGGSGGGARTNQQDLRSGSQSNTTKSSLGSSKLTSDTVVNPDASVDLTLLPPMLPLRFNSDNELLLQSEIELMSGLTALIHVLGHGRVWRQLWERYCDYYTASQLGRTFLETHYSELRAAVQSGCLAQIRSVLKSRFKLSV